MRISDWSSDVCSSDLTTIRLALIVLRRIRCEAGVEGPPSTPSSCRHPPAHRAAGNNRLPCFLDNEDHQCYLQHLHQAHKSAIQRSSRSEEHTSELQSLMRISYAVFCLQQKTHKKSNIIPN